MGQDTVLTRDDILKADEIKKELVDLAPYMVGKVWVRGMTAYDRDVWEDYMLSMRDAEPLDRRKGRARALIAALCCVDEKGQRLFTIADVEKLKDKSALAIDKIVSVAQRLSFVTEQDIEEAAKNS